MNRKYWTILEASKKLNLSTSAIYERIKRGQIKDIKQIKGKKAISSIELLKLKCGGSYGFWKHENIQVMETQLGAVRRLKNKNLYVFRDFNNLGFCSSRFQIISKDYITSVSREESIELGVPTNHLGTLLISLKGIEEYLSKSNKNIDKTKLLQELEANIEPLPTKSMPKQLIIPEVGFQEPTEVIETDLTPIEIALGVDEEGKTTARKLYEFLELNISNYAKWAKNKIIDNEFAVKNVDFIPFVLNDEHNPNPTTDYKLTASFAKKLAMGTHNKKGELAKEYFIKIEEKLKQNIISSRTAQTTNPYINFTVETRQIMMNDIELSIKGLSEQKAIIDAELLKNINTLNLLNESMF